MRRAGRLGLGMVAILAAGVCWAQARGPSAPNVPQEVRRILDAIGAVNRFADSYTAIMRIESHAPGEPPAITTYRMYTKGLRKALMIYQEPTKDAGKKIALNAGSLWFYAPRAGRAMPIRPMNTLTGSIAVGDLIGEPILDLYDLQGFETPADGATVLTFAAKNRSSPYGKLVYEYRNGRLSVQRSYTRSGIHLKTVTFLEFAAANGGQYATAMEIRNAVYPDYYAVIGITQVKPVPSIPDFFFTPEGLEDAGYPGD